MNIPWSNIMTSGHIVLAHQLVQMLHFFFGCLHLERDNLWPFAEVVNYHENISVAIGSWLEADHQINGYLAPGFVRHNHTVELGMGLLQVCFLHNLAFVAGIYEVGHILGDPRPALVWSLQPQSGCFA